MKDNDYLKDLHIGKIIKEISLQKGVASKRIAETIGRYQHNADKIFRLDDMDIEDIVKISYLLEYNILDTIVKKYLPHLSDNVNSMNTDCCVFKIDMRSLRVTTYDKFNNCNFLKQIHIGQIIREVAKKYKWNEQDMAKRLNYSQGTISHLYQSKSLKLKTLIQISDTMKYHFIAEVYLSQMVIAPALGKFDNCIIRLNSQQISIINAKNKNILMVFERNGDKK